MFREIENLLVELATKKVQIRGKAFVKLYDILCYRLKDLQKEIDKHNEDEISWEKIFKAAHLGIISHSEHMSTKNDDPNENDSKIVNYSRTVLKICVSPEESGISYLLLMKAVSEVFRTDILMKYFGKCYFQLLQKYILKPKNNLTQVTVDKWKDVLEMLFVLMKSKRHKIAFIDVVSCAKSFVEIGCSFSHLSSDIVKYLIPLAQVLENREDDREKLELLFLAYHCCRNIAADFRFEICRFTELITKHIHRVFKVELNESAKETLFKLMDLSIIVHYPNLETNGRGSLEYVKEVEIWNSGLRNYSYIVDIEIARSKSKYLRNVNENVDQVFAQFAARVCFLFRWDESFWLANDEENSSKRVCLTKKLQSLMELAKPSSNRTDFNWKWLAIIAEVIHNYPSALENEDFQPLLQMLSECQASAELEYQIYAFTKCCFVLLERDESFTKNTNAIIAKLCSEYWHQIADGALRACTSKNKSLAKSHALLQIIMHHHKYPTNNFIEEVIKIFLTKSTEKLETTMQTLVTLLTSFNLDLLPNEKELTAKLLKYTLEKTSLADLKQIIAASEMEKPSTKTLAHIGAMCCLSKTDVVNFSKDKKLDAEVLFQRSWKLEKQKAYLKEIREMTQLIRLKCFDRLLIENKDFISTQKEVTIGVKNKDFPEEIKCIMNNADALLRITEFKSKVIDESNNAEEIKDYLKQVMENNELMIYLADSFLSLEALNEEMFEGSFTVKKLDFHIQQIERLFGLILEKKIGTDALDMKDTYQLLTLVKSMFNSNLHQKICKKVRSFSLKNSLRWVSKQVKHKFRMRNEDDELMHIGWNEFANAKMEERMKFLAVETLCEYNSFQGVDTEFMADRLSYIKFENDDNMDLHTIFHVLKVFGSHQTVPPTTVQWIWENIMPICQNYHTHQYVSSRLIESLADIVYLSKDNPEMTTNVITLFSSFAKLCASPMYNSAVTIEFIRQFRFFHQEYVKLSAEEDDVINIYEILINKFLESQIFAVKLAAIEGIGFILSSDIEKDELIQARDLKNRLFKQILANHTVKFTSDAMETENAADDDDDKLNRISSYVQLFTSIFCTNFIMRKSIIFEMSKLSWRYQLSDETSLKLFHGMLKFLKCDAESLFDSNSIVNFLLEWLQSYREDNIPWYFTGRNSYADFVQNHYDAMALAILKKRPREIDEFCRTIEYAPKLMLQEVMTNCFAFVLPIEAGCQGIVYEARAEELKRKIDNHFSADEQESIMLRRTAAVISHVLENVFDKEKFKEFNGFDFEILYEVEMIDCVNFNKCLNHLKRYFSIPANSSIMTFFCNKRSNFIEQLLMTQKKKIQCTKLKEHKVLYFLQYCVLVEKLFEYFNDSSVSSATSIKGFLIKEIVYFICFLLSDETYGERLRQTVVSFFSKFLSMIFPVCADDVKPLLHKIFSTLVTICSIESPKMNSFEQKCFNIIEFLMNDQGALLENEILNLDKFPDTEQFHQVREKQLAVKYKNGTFTLEEEIDLFLKVEKRKAEGLIALRKHLSQEKTELKVLYDVMSETLGFRGDGENNLIHKLLRSLICYAQSSSIDEQRSIEAVKCLGEIGIYDLVTMVFVTENHQKVTIYKDMESVIKCQETICQAALEKMETIVMHTDPRIFEAASKACYHMLESTSSKNYKLSIYLRPFNTNTSSGTGIFYETVSQTKKLNFIGTFKKSEFSSYQMWIKGLVSSMLIFVGDKTLEPVASAQTTFSETLSPMLFQLLLMYDEEQVNKEIIEGIDFFFAEAAVKISHPKANEGSNYLNKLAIKQIIKLVECIRIHCQDHRKSDMAKRLSTASYLHIAKASKHCEAFFTAVLYCEKWAEKRLEEKSSTFTTSINDKTFQEIMYESFTAIGIHDASGLFANPTTMRPLYLQTCNRNWQNVLECDAVFKEDQTEYYVKLLNEMGLHSLTQTLASSSNDQRLKSNQFECLWRMSKWDIVIEDNSETKDITIVDHRAEFEKLHYASLKCLKNGDELGVKNAILKARKSIVQLLQQESLECTKNFYKFLGMSQLLQQVEDFGVVRFHRVADSSEKLLQKWNTQNELPSDYKLIEPILVQRNSIYDTANIKSGKRDWIPAALQSNMLLIVKESIDAACETDAIKMMMKMRYSSELTVANEAELLIHEAKLNIKTNINLAKLCLKRVFEEKAFDKQHLLKSIAYRLYGEILAESHADEFSKINDNYFQKSIKNLEIYAKIHNKSNLVAKLDYGQMSQELSESQFEAVEASDEIEKLINENACVFNIVAKYFDREYVSRGDYIDSPDFQNKLKAIEKNKVKQKALEESIKRDKLNKDLFRSGIIFAKSLKIDELEVKETYKQKKTAAGNAMFYFLRSAINDSSPSDNVSSIFRIISIWLANSEIEVIWKMLKESLLKIPSYNFVVALPQLCVRITDKETDKSNTLLTTLIEKCAIEHPHHTLPLILALVNSYADSKIKSSQQEPRVIGAKKLWNSLTKSRKLPSLMLQQLQEMSSALIKLAYDECHSIPANHKVALLSKMSLIQCPTLEIPLLKDGNYSKKVISVVKWSNTINLCGGINAPKKISCRCSDGIERPQLLKGLDDMRQDAVMQQVFGVVNSLLANSKEIRKQHARVRTYKVVPLARRTGILEWCENTTTLGSFLTTKEKKGAHERYHPKDWTPNKCFQMLHEVDKEPIEKKEKVFLEICENIRPVFHQFFYENYKEPGQWFERRLAYTISVAVSSMVGYILGIGDRHVQNILIDYETAEVIHIDFGIAFEQGKVLPHPELVPFRLSRDVIAPMGVCGVNGVFRKTCEKTMKILRQNHKTLMTILEVLLYDPMYVWTLSTAQAQQYQFGNDMPNDDSNEARESPDSMASRALLRIQAKLKGQADDSSGYSSVEGQVECLINKATNTGYLSRLFRGWQAYL